MKIRDRIKELRRVPASELHPNPKNWRTHPKEQLDAIRGILAEVGFAGAELARELPDGSLQLIDGHARAEIAGDAVVPVLVLDVTDAEADKILATFDPIGAMAEADAVKLDAILREVETGSEALADMLTALAEDNGILDGLNEASGEVVEDEVPEPPVDPITKPGDLWILGRHRLLCGDSTKAEDVERVMGGERADCVFTDPPYNIASENNIYAADCSKAMSDLKDAAWDHDFHLLPALEQIPMSDNVSVYICTSHHLAPLIWEWMKRWADHYSWCVWSKPNPMPSLSKRHWTWSAELITYATRGKHTFNFPKDGHALCVWTFNKKSDGSHPTQKPLEVAAHGISHSSNPGDCIFDGFSGSGTTLIAAEQLNRTCYGIEISPAYCDVIVKRWEKLTGEKAVCHSKTPA